MVRVGRLAATCLLVAGSARAQAPSEADALFAEGQRLIDAHKIDEACEKFRASLQLEPALGTTLNLADCRERQSRVAEAYELYSQVADEAGRTGKQSQLAFARKRLDALAPKIVRVTVVVANATLAGLVVKLRDREVPADRWTRPIAVAPGSIAIEATAPAHEPFRTIRDAAAGEQITIEIPALPARSEPATSITAPPVAAAPAASGHSWMPWIVGGSGGVLVVSSAVLGLHAKSVYNDAYVMTAPMGNDKIHSAVVEANIATGLVVVGAVGVGVGVYLYLHERNARIVPTTDAHGVGAAVAGRW